MNIFEDDDDDDDDEEDDDENSPSDMPYEVQLMHALGAETP